jgi:hypothetical protein
VSFNSILFAVQLANWGLLGELERRIRALVRFYEPLGAPQLELHRYPSLRLAAGLIHFERRQSDQGPALVWGGPVPPALRSSSGLLDAGDHDLRELESVAATFASDERRAVLVAGAGGLTALYRAAHESASAFATHAVAAAWLASGRVEVISDAIPELLERGFVGDERTLVGGAFALATASRVDFTPGGASVRSYWPAEERWALVPEETAYDTAGRELVTSLSRRAASTPSPFLGLTAGLDSRAVAVALREARIAYGTFTWGAADWDDVKGAGAIADVLGVAHHPQPLDWCNDDDAIRLADSDARWTEGTAAVRLVAESYPAETSAVINGMGGEIGRAFYYDAGLASTALEPTLDRLKETFRSRRHARSLRDRLAQVHARQDSWVEDAYAIGLRGWRCLDVVYAEQRVRRWGRSMLPRLDAGFVPGFATPSVARSLVSLPLEERLVSGFHRRFVTARIPSLAPAVPPPPRQARRLTTLLPGARRLASVVRRTRAASHREPWFARDSWPSRPRLHQWIIYEALDSPLLSDGMGERWLARTRAGFLAGNAVETRWALLAAAPVALERAARDLHSRP